MRISSAGMLDERKCKSHMTIAAAMPAPASSAIIPKPPGSRSKWLMGGGFRMSKSRKRMNAVAADWGPNPGLSANASPMPRNSSMTTADGSLFFHARAHVSAAQVPSTATTTSTVQSRRGVVLVPDSVITAARLQAVPGACGMRPRPRTVAAVAATRRYRRVTA